MMKSVLLLALAVVSQAQIDYENCGAPTDLMVLTLVDASPFPPTTNSTLVFTIQGATAGSIVAGSIANLRVFFLGLQIENQFHDLCDWIAEAGDGCPKNPGDLVTMMSVFEIPAITPPGLYTIQMSALTVDSQQLFCVSAAVQIERGLKGNDPNARPKLIAQ